MANNQKTEQPAYLSRPADDPIRLAQEARAKKAEARAEMSPRQQQIQWAREMTEEVQVRLRYGQRRTFLGFILNAGEVTPSEKLAVLDSIQATLDFLRQQVSSTREQKVSVPVPDFMGEE